MAQRGTYNGSDNTYSDRREEEATPTELDEMLDQALRLTFPASDPIALHLERGAAEQLASATTQRRAAER